MMLLFLGIHAQNVSEQGKMTFQGSLFQSGEPFNGAAELTFSIPLSNGDTWTETLAGVNVTNGLYAVVLGNEEPIPIDLFLDASERTIAVSVEETLLGEVSLFPAFVPGVLDVDSVWANGIDIGTEDEDNIVLRQDGSATFTGTVDVATLLIEGEEPTFINLTDTLTYTTQDGDSQPIGLLIGVDGTAQDDSPNYGFIGFSETDGWNIGTSGISSSQATSDDFQYGLFGRASGEGSGLHYGVRGEASATNAWNIGLRGQAIFDNESANYGLWASGRNSTQSNIGVRGDGRGAAKYQHGVFAEGRGAGNGDTGEGIGEGSINFGVEGIASDNEWGNTGIEGRAEGDVGEVFRGLNGLSFGGADDTDRNYGVSGFAAGAGSNFGVYGAADGGSEAWAGYFEGDTRVTGDLTIDGNLNATINPNFTTLSVSDNGASFDAYIVNDPDNNDPEGYTAEVFVNGDQSPNVQMGGQPWENGDLGFFQMYGSNPDENGWYFGIANLSASRDSDTGEEWGSFSLERNDGTTSASTIQMDARDGSASFAGNLNSNGEFGLYSNNNAGFMQMGPDAARFGTPDLPFFFMFGDDKFDEDGNAISILNLQVGDDGDGDYSRLSMSGASDASVELDGGSGSGYFSGDLTVDGSINGSFGELAVSSFTADSLATGSADENFSSLISTGLNVEDEVSGEFMELRDGYLRFRSDADAFSSVVLNGSSFGEPRLQLSEFDDGGTHLATTFLGTNANGGYFSFNDADFFQTVSFRGDTASANFQFPDGGSVSLGANAGPDAAEGSNLPYFFLFGDDGGNAPVDFRVEDQGDGNYGRMILNGPNDANIFISGSDGSGYFSGDLTVDGNLSANIDPNFTTLSVSENGASFDAYIVNDPDNNDPDGYTAEVFANGDQSPNVQFGGQPWENGDLGFFQMYGSNPDENGWYFGIANISAGRDGDTGEEWGSFSLESNDGTTSSSTIQMDGRDGSASFAGNLNTSGEFGLYSTSNAGFMQMGPDAARFGTPDLPFFFMFGDDKFDEDGNAISILNLQVGDDGDDDYSRLTMSGVSDASVELDGGNGSGYFSGDLTVDGTLSANIDPSFTNLDVSDNNASFGVTIVNDPNGGDPDGFTAEGFFFGDETPNIQMGGKPWENGDLANLGMFGTNSDEPGGGWYFAGLIADIGRDDGADEEWGNLSLSRSFADDSQEQTISLDGRNGSISALDLSLNNASNNNVASIYGNWGDFGQGAMQLRDGDGNDRITISVNNYDDNGTNVYHGMFATGNNQNSSSARVDGNGIIEVSNGNDQTNASLYSGWGTDGQGALVLRDANAVDRAFLEVNDDASGNYWGALLLRDAAGNDVIALNGENGDIAASGNVASPSADFGDFDGGDGVRINEGGSGGSVLATGGISGAELRAGDYFGGNGLFINGSNGNVQTTGAIEAGDANDNGVFIDAGSTSISVISGGTGADDGSEVARIDGSGNGTFAGEVIIGDFFGATPGVQVNTGNIEAQGNINAASLSSNDGFTSSSDSRLKQNVNTIEGALANTQRLRGVTYEWNEVAAERSNVKEGDNKIGLIAQEVEKVFPELVKTGSDGFKSVDYVSLTAVLVEAIKELNAEVSVLKLENTELKAEATKTAELSKRLETIEKLLQLKAGSSTSNAKN